MNPFFFIFPNFCKFSFLLANFVLTLDFYSICDWLSSVIGWVRHLANTILKSKNLSLKCFLVMWCNSEAASNWSLLSRNEFSKMTAKVFIKMQLIISSKKTRYHPALFSYSQPSFKWLLTCFEYFLKWWTRRKSVDVYIPAQKPIIISAERIKSEKSAVRWNKILATWTKPK